jgi:hypothetical protein
MLNDYVFDLTISTDANSDHSCYTRVYPKVSGLSNNGIYTYNK